MGNGNRPTPEVRREAVCLTLLGEGSASPDPRLGPSIRFRGRREWQETGTGGNNQSAPRTAGMGRGCSWKLPSNTTISWRSR